MHDMPFPTARILHFSDLHIGQGQVGDVSTKLRGVVAQLKADAPNDPKAIIVSGDIRDAKSLRTYDFFSKKADIDVLIRELSPSTLRIPVIVVPGNHDVTRAKIGSSETVELRLHGFQHFARKLYQAAAPSVAPPSSLLADLHCEHAFAGNTFSGRWILHDLQCVVHYVNSVLLIPDPDNLKQIIGLSDPSIGRHRKRHLEALCSVLGDKNLWIYYPAEFLNSLQKFVQEKRYLDYVQILVTHNPPYETPYFDNQRDVLQALSPQTSFITSTQLLKTLGELERDNAKFRIALMLHGDLHLQRQSVIFREYGETDPLYAIGCGWAAERRNLPYRHYNQISLRRPEDLNLVEVEIESHYDFAYKRKRSCIIEFSSTRQEPAAPLDVFPRIGWERKNGSRYPDHSPMQEYATYAQGRIVSDFDRTMRELLKEGTVTIGREFLYTWYYEFLPSIAGKGKFFATHCGDFARWTETGPIASLQKLFQRKTHVHRCLVIREVDRMYDDSSGQLKQGAVQKANYIDACQRMWNAHTKAVGGEAPLLDLRVCYINLFERFIRQNEYESRSDIDLLNAAVLIPNGQEERVVGFFFSIARDRTEKLTVTIDPAFCQWLIPIRSLFEDGLAMIRFSGQDAREFARDVETAK